MTDDSTDHPKPAGPRKGRRGSEPELPPQDPTPPDIDPATASAEEDEEARLHEAAEEPAGAVAEGPLAIGHAAIENAVRLAPTSPGVYRMLNAANDVLYVGKAKNVRKRLTSYARVNAPQPARILRMIAATVTVEIISTTTETEALLLEANLIKQLKPRFNVQLRDDKSFPYILITGDHWAPQILKHRGAQSRPGRYFGPFANAGAVNRTITALQRAFLVRSCTDSFFESRTRPCLLYQIKRCAAPCTGEISHTDYAGLVREAKAFLENGAIDRLIFVISNSQNDLTEYQAEVGIDCVVSVHDIEALIAYLRSRPAIGAQTPNPPDRFNLLGLMMLGAGLLPSGSPVFTGAVKAPGKSPTAEYGEYILSYQDCRACHGASLTGGVPGQIAPVGPSLQLVKSWKVEQFIATFRTGKDPTGRQLSEVMPWRTIGQMDDDELTAIYEYLTHSFN